MTPPRLDEGSEREAFEAWAGSTERGGHMGINNYLMADGTIKAMRLVEVKPDAATPAAGGMTIARAHREGLRAEVWFSNGPGRPACVGICAIQLEPWTHTDESAKAFADAYNLGADHMRAALKAAQPVERESAPAEPQPCPHCDGSGEVTVMSDGGPDAYEVPVECPHCHGNQTLEAAYNGVVKLLDRSEDKYRECAAILYLGRADRKASDRITEIAEYITKPGAQMDWAHDRLIALADMAKVASPAETPPAAGAIDAREQHDEALMKLSQFAHTAAHMGENDMRNNLSSIADQLIVLASREEAPERSPLEELPPGHLYRAVNNLLCHIGMEGSIDSRHGFVEEAMDALHAIDGGVYLEQIASREEAPAAAGAIDARGQEVRSEAQRIVDRLMSDDPDFADCEAAAKFIRENIEGPTGYATWKDAAVAERVRRVKAEAPAAAGAAQAVAKTDKQWLEFCRPYVYMNGSHEMPDYAAICRAVVTLTQAKGTDDMIAAFNKVSGMQWQSPMNTEEKIWRKAWLAALAATPAPEAGSAHAVTHIVHDESSTSIHATLHAPVLKEFCLEATREDEGSNWYIEVTDEGGYHTYDGYWRDSANRSCAEVLAEAADGSLLHQIASPPEEAIAIKAAQPIEREDGK